MKAAIRKKTLSVLLCAAMLCSLMVTTAFASGATDSTSTLKAGSADATGGTYKIYDQTDMDAFVAYVNAGRNTAGVTFEIDGTGKTYNVTSVIAVPTISSYSTSSPYVSGGTGFRGVFDGKGNAINVTLSTSASGTGLFGYLAPGGKVQNLTVGGSVSVSGGRDAVGGVVGYNSGVIDKVTSTVTVTANSAYNVGGIAGFNDNYYMPGAVGTIRNCRNNGTVSGSSKVGGITGENAGLITSCYNTAAVTSPNSGKNGVGGIAGRNGNNNTAVENGRIQNCYNTANITCTPGKWVGGITGFLNALSTCVNSYDTGNISAVSYTDPISGNTEGTNTNCYYLNTVTVVEGFDGSTALTAPELNGTNTVGSTGEKIVTLLNDGGSSWQQTTGNNPTLTGTDTRVAGAATGVIPGPAPTPETDGYTLGGVSADYADLASALTAAKAADKPIYVTGTVDLPTGTYDGAYTVGATAKEVTIKRSVTFTGILFTVNVGAAVAMDNLTIDGNSSNSVVGSNLIRVYDGSLTMSGTVELKNSTINSNGGAIHVQGGTVTSAATISNCSARSGGGAYVSGGSLTLAGGSISGCSAQEQGAGVYVSAGTTFALNASSLTIDNEIYLESGAYITVAQAIPGDLTVESAVTTGGTVIAQGTGSYTLTDTDMNHITLTTWDSLTRVGNQIIISL